MHAIRPAWHEPDGSGALQRREGCSCLQASDNAKQRDGFGGTWAQDYFLPAKADGCGVAPRHTLPCPALLVLVFCAALWISLANVLYRVALRP